MGEPDALAREWVLRRALLAASHDGPDPGQQLARIEGFGEIIIRAAFQTLDAVVVLSEGGQHQDRCAALLTQSFARSQPVFAGHHHIEHDQIERMSCALSVHLCGTFGDRGSHAVPFEIA